MKAESAFPVSIPQATGVAAVGGVRGCGMLLTKALMLPCELRLARMKVLGMSAQLAPTSIRAG